MAKRKATEAEEAPAASSGSYTVLARRYRPQSFEQIVGQEAVAKALTSALKSNRVAHAYLFTGARGVGKTSTARILAKALNCVKGPTVEPCGACDICQAITDGSDIDVVEIDGASNRGIDEIRAIRANVALCPARSRYKIYIIDEVHALSKDAFNALLKTLEEPPPHVKFIFATTEVNKVPITVLSRCQRFDFPGIGTSAIIERLKEIVQAEGMKADAEALELIARRAGGSMRDSQSLLDQLLAFGGKELTADQVHALLGTAPVDRVAALAEAVLNQDAKKALEMVDEAARQGLQLGELVDQLIDYWRDLMVVNVAGLEASDLSVPSRFRQALKQQAERLKLDAILAGLDILTATKARLRGSQHGRVLLEMALVRLGRLGDLVALSELAEWLSGTPVASAERRTVESSVRNQASGVRIQESDRPVSLGAAFATTQAAPSMGESGPKHEASKANLTTDSLPRFWPEVLAQLGKVLGMALEKASLPAIFGPNGLAIRFPAEYNSQQKHCEDLGGSAKVEAVLRNLTGQSWTVKIETLAGSGPAAAGPKVDAAESSLSRQRLLQEAAKEPLVKKAMEVLDAKPFHTDPGFGSVAAANQTEAGEEE